MNSFIGIAKRTQSELHLLLKDILETYDYKVVDGEKWLYAFHQKEPVLLTAHLDTVFKETVKDVVISEKDGNHIISSPQGIGGDDRCGVWMILESLKDNYRPAILFCHDEELGGIGAQDFIKNSSEEIFKDINNLKYFIEVDRANRNDCVFYDCDNPEFTKYVESFGFKEAMGSFSDISFLAPHFKKAAVNISTGDYKQHQVEEYVVYEEMMENYERLKEMLDDSDNAEMYEYIESEYTYSSYYGNEGDLIVLALNYYEGGESCTDIVYGRNESEAMYNFLVDHPSVCMNDVTIEDTWIEFDDPSYYDGYYDYYDGYDYGFYYNKKGQY